jgi:predicted phosphodiesterase
MKFLCLSDIHGNARALKAILADAKVRGYDQLVVCGDLCFPGPDALLVWKILVKENALCVQGLSDRALCSVDPKKLKASSALGEERIKRLIDMKAELGEIIIARLGKLPAYARLPLESGHTMLVVHGSPADPSDSLSREMSEEELVAALGDEPGDLVICGSSHEQFEGEIADVHIASVGSVGDAPGGTHAFGAIVESNQVGFTVTMIQVPIDSDIEYGAP